MADRNELTADEIAEQPYLNDMALVVQVIRDLAGTVIASAATRRHHPSYGVTLTKIRAERERMEGAIGVFMVLTTQATHAGVPALAVFDDAETADLVARARKEADSL
jgi:hypothetical protein